MAEGTKKNLEVFETEDVAEPLGLNTIFTKKSTESSSEALDSSTVNPRDAFLKFQNDALAKEQSNSRFFHKNYSRGAGSSQPEDALTKYTRLQSELADLRKELNSLAQKGDETKDIFTSVKSQEAAELSQGAHVLQTQLEQLADNERFKPFLAPEFDGASTVASQQLLQKIQEMKPGDAGAKKSKGKGKTEEGLTYELFYNKDLQKQSSTSSLNGLENRLYSLEQAVGLKSLDVSAVSTPSPLSAVITSLEEKVSLLDPKTLETLQTKMLTLSGEFDAFTAKRNSTKGSRVALTDDIQRERLDALFNKVEQWSPVAETIPTLISRMQTLKQLHEESALFSQRLHGLESMQEGLQKLLSTDEKALANVQKSLASNIETVMSNIAAVDERLAAVSAKVSS